MERTGVTQLLLHHANEARLLLTLLAAQSLHTVRRFCRYPLAVDFDDESADNMIATVTLDAEANIIAGKDERSRSVRFGLFLCLCKPRDDY